jgi:predicted nucleotidyltransferase
VVSDQINNPNFLMKISMQQILENRIADIRKICSSLGVERLYAFGSVVTEKFNSDSDIDFLISFSDKLSIEEYSNNYFALHYKLQELFERDIDLVTERTLSNPYLIESIDESKKLLYEA